MREWCITKLITIIDTMNEILFEVIFFLQHL